MAATEATYLDQVFHAVARASSVDALSNYARYYSGYVREAAIRRCIDLAQPEMLPLVVERLNDWVPQIRDVARQALLVLLPLVSVGQLLSVLPAMWRLHGVGRGDTSEWLSQFELALIQRVSAAGFVAAAQGADINIARACVQLVHKHRLLGPAALIDLILMRNDDIVLANQAAAMCAELPLEARGAHYRAAAASHFGSVRTTAIRALLTMEGEARMAIAMDALNDVQSSVRSAAMAYLAPLGFDLRGHYRNMLQQPGLATKQVRIALSALAGLRGKDDVELVKSFLNSGRISIRLAALAAWLKLAEHDKDLTAGKALADAAPGVRRFALQLVRKHGAYLPFATIRTRLKQVGDVELLLLFAESKKWVWLECIARLNLQHGVQDSIKLVLEHSLLEWLRTSGRWYDQPDAGQAAFLSSEPVVASLAALLGGSPGRKVDLRKVLAHHGLEFGA